MPTNVAVLVSVGRHPASGRARRAVGDARALELALSLGGDTKIHLIHAGNPDEPVLREYMGMGVPEITVLKVPEDGNVVPALVDYLKQLKPDIILTGTQAEHGPSSGYLPYAVANGLGYPMVPAIAGLEVGQGKSNLAQALPRGRRRALEVKLPFVATVDKAAAIPRQSAFGLGRRGQTKALDNIQVPAFSPPWQEQPARKRPKRLKVMAGGSAADRLRAASQTQAGKGSLMVNPDPDEAAQAIYNYLVEEGILKP